MHGRSGWLETFFLEGLSEDEPIVVVAVIVVVNQALDLENQCLSGPLIRLQFIMG